MMRLPCLIFLQSFLILIITVISCQKNSQQGDWIKGNEKEQLKTIEWQLRGFDKAMVETDYRYQELFWAGKDENWEYALYLNQKIKKAIETGLQRRPKRATSSRYFIQQVLPEMQKAIESKDTSVFNNTFKKMTTQCNTCHALENLPFFTVKTPLKRHSSIRK